MVRAIDFDALAVRISEHEFAYLITVGEDHRVHTSPVNPAFAGNQLTIKSPSPRVEANTEVRPHVSLVWPPTTADGYSLIVDGDAQVDVDVDADVLRITPTRAILHRPTPRPEPGGGEACGSDCIEL